MQLIAEHSARTGTLRVPLWPVGSRIQSSIAKRAARSLNLGADNPRTSTNVAIPISPSVIRLNTGAPRINTLNDDVQGLIAECVHRTPLYQDFAAYRLICQNTARAGQRRMFQEIRIRSPGTHRRTTAIKRIETFLSLRQKSPSLSRHPKRLHLYVGEDDGWLRSEEAFKFFELLAQDTIILELTIIGQKVDRPLSGQVLSAAITPISSSVVNLHLENVDRVTASLFHHFRHLEHLVMRGITRHHDSDMYHAGFFKPKLRTLRYFNEPSSTHALSYQRSKEGVLDFLCIDSVTAIHSDSRRLHELAEAIHRSDNLMHIKELAIDVSLTPKDALELHECIRLPMLENVMIQTVHFPNTRPAHEAKDPLDAVSSVLKTLIISDSSKIQIDVVVGAITHSEVLIMNWSCLDSALASFAAGRPRTSVFLRCLRHSGQGDTLQVAYISQATLRSIIPKSTSVSRLCIRTISVADMAHDLRNGERNYALYIE